MTIVRRPWQPGDEYNLQCPQCSCVVSGSLRPDTALQLVAEGARLVEVNGQSLGPITPEEVDAFRAALDAPGALERELAGLR